ncbi:MAG: AmmeMemoRadiSam system protein A [Acidaminobacteraceae bacterium]
MSISGGFIMPHPPVLVAEVGMGEQYKARKTLEAMEKVAKEIAEIKPKTIIIISPHGPLFSDAITIRDDELLFGDLSAFEARQVRVTKKNDFDLKEDIIIEAMECGIPIARINDDLADRFDIDKNLDHSVLVPLHFIDKKYSDYELVSINYGFLSASELYKFGICIRNVIEHKSKSIVVIASGDLSHKLMDTDNYSFSENGVKFDQMYQKAILGKDIVSAINFDPAICEEAGECGKKSIDVLLGVLESHDFNVERYSYEYPFGVGYSVISFKNIKRDNSRKIFEAIIEDKECKLKVIKDNESDYVKLARKAIEKYILKEKKISLPKSSSKELFSDKAGVFVSLKTDSGLRGCIGTTSPICKNLGEEIIENAIKSASMDSRFETVDKSELCSLIISVDVLSKPEFINDIDELDPKIYGLIVESDYKRGLLLPNLEGINSVEEQIKIALNKGGINPHEVYKMYRFTVERHK